MTTSTQYAPAPSNKARWAGRILSGLAIAFLVVDSFMKLAKTAPAVKGTAELGYPPSLLVPLGIILLSCVVLYALPKTSVLGAILLTAYLGGAVATQVRVGKMRVSRKPPVTLVPTVCEMSIIALRIGVGPIFWFGLIGCGPSVMLQP